MVFTSSSTDAGLYRINAVTRMISTSLVFFEWLFGLIACSVKYGDSERQTLWYGLDQVDK